MLHSWIYIYTKEIIFINDWILSIKVFHKPENKYMYCISLLKSAHPRHTIKNYILGELKRYLRINTEEVNFLKIRNSFFLRLRNRGFKKLSYHDGFRRLDIHSEPNILALTQEIFVISREQEKHRQNPFWSTFRRGYWEKLFPGSLRIPRKWF